MQGDLTPRLEPILSGQNMTDLWTNACRPRPEEAELRESVWRVCSEFLSRPLTIGMGVRMFNLDPYSRPLTIHMVGAAHSETLGARTTDMDELGRMFPGHQGLEGGDGGARGGPGAHHEASAEGVWTPGKSLHQRLQGPLPSVLGGSRGERRSGQTKSSGRISSRYKQSTVKHSYLSIKFGVEDFDFYAHQGCTYLIKNTVKIVNIIAHLK